MLLSASVASASATVSLCASLISLRCAPPEELAMTCDTSTRDSTAPERPPSFSSSLTRLMASGGTRGAAIGTGASGVACLGAGSGAETVLGREPKVFLPSLLESQQRQQASRPVVAAHGTTRGGADKSSGLANIDFADIISS